MYLTKKEEKILAGEYGEGKQKAMEILLAIGKIYGGDRLIPITSAHISGVSYHNIGDAGLTFLKDFSAMTKVSVKTTLNPGGADLHRWREMGIKEKFIKRQREIISVFKGMGIDITLTCTPYLVGNLPRKGEHIAWSESSAVTYINSVAGAMTNRESGISALAAAIIGKTPRYGMHVKDERGPSLRVKLNVKLNKISDYGALGYALSKRIDNEIPLIEGIGNVDNEKIMMLSASIATYCGLPIFHIPEVTAESRDFVKPYEKVEIDMVDMRDAYEYLNDSFDKVDLVWIGCPHTTLDELKKIAKLLDSKNVNTEVWITTSRYVMERAKKMGYIEKIEDSGAKVICDTCVAVAPLKDIFRTLVTTSAKACYYSRGVNNLMVKVADLEKCINIALTGVWK